MVWLYILLFAGQFDISLHDGLIALNQNNLALAESRLEAAAQLEPHNPQAWLALAQTYWKLREPARARAAARNAEEFGDSAVILHALSVFYAETADSARAASLLEAAIRRNPYDESYYFELAQLHLKQQDFAAALEALNAGRKVFDKSPQLELAAGVAYYGLRRFPEAMDAFLRTLQLDDSIEQPYVFLGRMLDQAEGRLPRITEAFAAFARRAPDNYLSSYLYGKALAMAGDAGAAENLLRKSIARNGTYWESHFELGVLLGERREFDEAAGEIRAAIRLNPNDAAAHYHLARLYDLMGRPGEAKAERELHAKLSAAAPGMAGIK
jgi:tetratricopeptide (TPR) repeat protein